MGPFDAIKVWEFGIWHSLRMTFESHSQQRKYYIFCTTCFVSGVWEAISPLYGDETPTHRYIIWIIDSYGNT